MSTVSGTAPLRVCSTCGVSAATDARFCEACGQDLPGAPPTGPTAPTSPTRPTAPTTGHGCRECGGTVAPDGYCTVCGGKAPRPRDHLVEQPQPWVGAVSDRGVRHHRNEDAMATAADPEPGSRAVLVVCDGVSSSSDSDVASLAAAHAARAVLDAARARGMGTDSALTAALGARLVAAADAASRAVSEQTRPEHAASPPSCTFVAAVVEDGRAVVGVVGDSRAYWLPDVGTPVALTTDDSWAAEQIATGVPREVAENGPQAHAITRWLGVDAPDHRPRLTAQDVHAAGWLLLCSDGLWNYCSTAEAVAEQVARAVHDCDGEPLASAQALVAWANEQGGHDNITVVLARMPGPDTASAQQVTDEGATDA